MSLSSRASTLIAATPAGRVAEALAARKGDESDNPRLRPDLVVRRLVQLGEVSWGVKNPETLNVYTFGEAEWEIIRRFDGTMSRSEIASAYNRANPDGPIPLTTVLDFEESLKKMDLLEKSGAERNLALLARFQNARKRTAEEKSEGFNIFLILFHVMDPDRFLNRTVRYVRWLWKPATVAAGMTIFLLTAGVFIGRFSLIWQQTVELYSFLSKPFWDFLQFFVIMTAIGAVHEFGHAFAIKIHGGDVHDIGFALFYFTPAYYCDSTDAYLFQNKWHRLWVALGGIYVECYICAIATGIWVVSYPDTIIHDIAYKLMLYTGVSTVFFNINPMVKTDGYHVLSGILEMPQLREESFQYLGALFQRNVLRLPVEVPAASRRKRRIYWSYGPIAILYTGLIMYLIGKLFAHVYSKFLPDFAVVLSLITLFRVFRKRLRLGTDVVRMFYLDKKEFLMSPRVRTKLAAAGAAILLLAVLPIFRETVEETVSLEPGLRSPVVAGSDGVVAEILVDEGSRVTKGQPIATLRSVEIDSNATRLSRVVAGEDRAADVYRAGFDPAGLADTAERSQAARAALSAATDRLSDLALASPADGVILTPRPKDSTGRFVRAGEVLAEVGDNRSLKAEIPVSERFLSDLKLGQTVSVFLPSRPFRALEGRVTEIAPAATSRGTDRAAEEAGASAEARPSRFIVTAVFENPDASLRPGMSADVKIRGEHRAFLARGARLVWRWGRRVFW